MKKYLLLYMGSSENMIPSGDEMQAQMAEWSAWYGQLGAAFAYVDGGAPLHPMSKLIDGKGKVSDGPKGAISGYTIIQADSYDSAVKMAMGCPVLKQGISVSVLETMGM